MLMFEGVGREEREKGVAVCGQEMKISVCMKIPRTAKLMTSQPARAGCRDADASDGSAGRQGSSSCSVVDGYEVCVGPR
jgi:hypothetical protein